MAVKSFLEVMDVGRGERRVVYEVDDHIEAPNWSRDGACLIYNSHGKMYRLPVSGGESEVIDTGTCVSCNNDHGLSPDGRWLAISDKSGGGQSQVYILPSEGGTPRLVTELAPSYWHGWSPDGETLAYTGKRDDNFDIYTIPFAGGEETRLTTDPALDDGPDYTSNGEWIYYNSARTGIMRIWRMHPDGTGQEQVTFDEQYACVEILLADDEKDILHIYSELLDGNGFDVTPVSSGREVLCLLDETVFDMLILDLYMPEMNGFEAISALREKGYTVPVIVMTGHFPDEVVQDRLRGLNVETTLRKPVMISTLLHAVNETIGV